MSSDEETITQGTLRTSTGQPLPLEHTDIKARIGGPVASVDVRQVFRNNTGGAIEAVYLFPLPHEASVYRMEFRIGDRTVKGVIKEKEEAKRAYERAKSEGRSATLLEQDRPNLFTLSVANIPAGEAIEVTLGYQEKLAFDDDEWRFVFPMVAGERYHSGKPTPTPTPTKIPPKEKQGAATATTDVPDAARIRPPKAATGERAGDIAVEVEIHAGKEIDPPRSPSHRIDVEQMGMGAYKVRLSPSDAIPNRDFVLAYKAARAGVRPEVYFERKEDRPGTFLLVVTPPATPPPDDPTWLDGGGSEGHALRCSNCGGELRDTNAVRDVPGIGPAWKCAYCGAVIAATRDRKFTRIGLPRDVVFLIDRSASMRGGSVPQARRAVRLILDHLGSNDAVQLFAFDHDRVAADGHGDAFMPLSDVSIQQIDSFLAGLKARGGSELEEALERAAKLPNREGRTKLVVLLTDAAVGNDGRLLRRAREILGDATRLYVLGVGPAVNRYLVERLARACGGASDVLLPTEDVETVVPRFARRVRQAGPVLTSLKLVWDDALPADVYPSPIPDLFGGQPVQLLGRFSGSGKTRLVLLGTTAKGEPFRQEVDVDLPEVADQVPGLERLWAKLRIDSRLERLAREPAEASEIRLEVLGLALKHSLLSPYTALVAEDSEQRVKEEARRVDVKPAAVAGSSDEEEDEQEEDEEEARESATGGGRFADEDTDRVRRSELVSEVVDTGTRTRAGVVRSAPMRARGGGGAPGGGPPAGFGPPPAPPGYGAFSGDVPPSPGAPAGLVRPAPAAPEDGPDDEPAVLYSLSSLMSAPAEASDSARRSSARSAAAPMPAAGPMDLHMARSRDADEPAMARSFDADEESSAPPAPARERSFVSKVKSALGLGEAPPPPPPPPPAMALPPPAMAPPPMPGSPSKAAKPPPPVAPQQPQVAQKPIPKSTGTEDYPQEVLDWAAKRQIGELDLVFLVDETGSMGAYIEEVKRRLLDIIAALKSAPLCRSLRMGIVGYRDHPPQDYTFASRVVPLTDDIESIRRGVMQMDAQGGGDGPESVTDGLFDVVRLEWRTRAARVVVWVGDAPPHGVEPKGDSFPQGCPCGHHWYTQAESCREMGIVIHAVGCLPALHHYYVGAEQVFRTVASTTRGLFLPLTEAQILIPLITGVAETELDKQRIEERIAEVLAAHERELAQAEERERVRYVTDVLRQENVRPRGLVYDVARPHQTPLKFRDITPKDVEEGIDHLRRLGRTQL
jgi:Ca-activated chloride channel family protein